MIPRSRFSRRTLSTTLRASTACAVANVRLVSLAALVSASVLACDREDSDLEAAQPGVESLAVDNDSAVLGRLSAVGDPASSAIGVGAAEALGYISLLTDGDIVMIQNNISGYVGCDDNGNVVMNTTPGSTDGWLWKVHQVNPGGIGAPEFQFERLDADGRTFTYLKMDNTDAVFCGEITGNGDAASWTDATAALHGNFYRRNFMGLENYKHGRCVELSGGSASGVSCGGAYDKVFTIMVLDRLGNAVCDDDWVCACESDLQCGENQVCGATGYCQLWAQP